MNVCVNVVLILTDDGEQRLRQFSRCLPIREKGAPFRKFIVRVRHSIFVLSAKYLKKSSISIPISERQSPSFSDLFLFRFSFSLRIVRIILLEFRLKFLQLIAGPNSTRKNNLI